MGVGGTPRDLGRNFHGTEETGLYAAVRDECGTVEGGREGGVYARHFQFDEFEIPTFGFQLESSRL